MTIGDRMRKIRLDLGMSQTELAKKTKSSKQTIYKYETNIITNIPSDKIELIAKALATTPAYLMGWDNNLTKSKTNLVVDMLSDRNLIEHIEKLKNLSREHQQTIFDNIDYWYEKEGH
ncbi:MAG: helix-turn-helix domain-containing protein [Roseburia sp.]|nr:helix-turn-helix domain-containing protein [Roseburia sp.]